MARRGEIDLAGHGGLGGRRGRGAGPVTGRGRGRVPQQPKSRDRGHPKERAGGRDDSTAPVVETRPVDRATLPAGALAGVVIRAYGLWFDVQLRDDPRVLLCTIKGLLKRERRKTDLVAVGDRVWAVDVGEGEGQIVAVEPRTRVLARPARNTRDVEQVVLANADQALFLFAVREPSPHRRMLDRFLILAETAGLPALIGVNKIDLDLDLDLDGVNEPDGRSLAETIFHDYRAIYPVHFVSAVTGAGLPGLREALAGKVTAVAGPSGVGKSSLLNALHPAGNRAVGSISSATGKGRHTTIATQLYRFGPETFVADTPGIRALAMHGVPVAELDGLFPEFRPFLGACFYADCTHLHEPDCAVREALVAGAIAPERYASYAALRRGEVEERDEGE